MKLKFKNKKWGVIGLGKSGISAGNLLTKLGARVYGSEIKKENEIKSNLEKLNKEVKYETGQNSDKILEADFIVISPGVPKDIEIFKKIKNKKIPIISEIELSYNFIKKSKIIGITGTNGKTTTVNLIKHIFDKSDKKNILCGNVGVPVTSVLEDIKKDTYFIMEISSFQLEDIFDFRCDYSAILNITPDHYERYNNSIIEYKKAKYRIIENAQKKDWLLLNYDDSILRKDFNNINKIRSQIHCVSADNKINKSKIKNITYFENGIIYSKINPKIIYEYDVSKLKLLGMHNIYNTMFAIIPALLEHLNPTDISEALNTFMPVEHRLEKIVSGDYIFINDSKSTNVDSTLVALKSFKEKIILIMGGRDKGSPYTPLSKVIKNNVKLLLINGESGEKIKKDIGGYTKTIVHPSLKENLKYLKHKIKKGDTILLSPGCSSYDQFDNYVQRGNYFKEFIINEF